MTSVGSILRHKREADGRSLEEIAGRLCITPAYLRALEADDVGSLPGIFFYKSFAIQYATMLGLEGESLRTAISAACAPAEVEPARIEPTIQIASRAGSGRSRQAFGAGLAVLVCAGIASSSWSSDAPAAPAVAETQATEILPEPVVSNPVAVLNLAARETTWLSITVDGKEIFEGVLWPRQSKTLTGLDMARMKVGNAGGLDISWNGKPVGPIGETGEVRVVLFSADDVEVLPPGQTL